MSARAMPPTWAPEAGTTCNVPVPPYNPTVIRVSPDGEGLDVQPLADGAAIKAPTKAAMARAARAAVISGTKEQVERAQALLHPPADLGAWGVVRTRCWMALRQAVEHQATLQRVTKRRAERLRGGLDLIEELPTWSDERVAEVLAKLESGGGTS